MDKLTRVSFSIQQLAQLNVCRLYLNIIYLSDIIHSDGKTINHNFLIGIIPPTRSLNGTGSTKNTLLSKHGNFGTQQLKRYSTSKKTQC